MVERCPHTLSVNGFDSIRLSFDVRFNCAFIDFHTRRNGVKYKFSIQQLGAAGLLPATLPSPSPLKITLVR